MTGGVCGESEWFSFFRQGLVMLQEIQRALKFSEPKTAVRIANETGCSWQQVKSVIGQLVSADLCRPTARGYVRVR